MSFSKIVILVIMILRTTGIHAQDIDSHKWEKRLVLILPDQSGNENYRKQVDELKNHLDRVNERKVLVYHITPEGYKVGLSDESWQKADTDYSRFKQTDSQTEIVLIGLEGGIKLRANEFLSARKLFATIDAMPMRRQEIKR